MRAEFDPRDLEPALPPREASVGKRRSRLLPVGIALVALGGFGGIVWYAYHQAVGGTGVASAEPPANLAPLVRAETGPVRVRPDEPGGMNVPFRDTLVLNNTSGTPGGAQQVERLMPSPEAAMPRPQATAATTTTPTGMAGTSANGTTGGAPAAGAGNAIPPALTGPRTPQGTSSTPAPSAAPTAARTSDQLPAARPAAPPPAPTPRVERLEPRPAATPAPAVAPAPVPVPARAETRPAAAPTHQPAAVAAAPTPTPAPAVAPAPAPRAEIRPAPAVATAPPPPVTPTAAHPAPETRPTQVAAAPANSAVAAAAPAAAAHAGVRIQLSSLKSEEQVRSDFARMQKQYPSQLGHLQVMPQRADLGEKGVYWRVQAGPFTNADSAKKVCDELKAHGQACVLVR